MNPRAFREAAALLAAMDPVDRRWVLSRLPAAAVEALDIQIAALNAKSPVPFEWARQSLKSTQPGIADIPSPATLVEVLHALPAAWAARVLTVAVPDHEALYVASSVPARAAAVRAEADRHRGRMPSALVALMLRELRARAEADPAASAPESAARSVAA